MSSPSLVTAEERCNLTQLLDLRAATAPDHTFAELKAEDGTWAPVSLKEFHAQVRAAAKGARPYALVVEVGGVCRRLEQRRDAASVPAGLLLGLAAPKKSPARL